MAVDCPICNKSVKPNLINNHIDSGCESFVLDPSSSANTTSSPPPSTPSHTNGAGSMLTQPKRSAASTFFQTPAAKRQATTNRVLTPNANGKAAGPLAPAAGKKRAFDDGPGQEMVARTDTDTCATTPSGEQPQQPPAAQGVLDAPAPKRTKTARSAPLAERMRPQALDDVFGQDLVGPHGVLRSLIETDRVPSMILWGGSGTGKTTIARCIAHRAGSRFIELNATSTGVAEVKKMLLEAANDLALTGRKTIIFCDEIHRFTKAQQDVFLKPVEAGTITLVGATTENPSFRVGAALLSRCRTFTLQKLSAENIAAILRRAVAAECPGSPPPLLSDGANADHLLTYLAAFADGDARTALNLLELALSLAARPDTTMDDLKASLTKTLVYDRAGDQHYDTISAFHKAVRGSDPDAALYYLARMLQSGEDPLFVARRMVVIASEDVGLADNSLLPLATAAYTAAQQIGMPEARIPLAHAAVALSLAPKSTRAYRALNNAYSALREPGVAALPVPIPLRNAPTRLMREMGFGAEYKYPPNYRDGKVRQDYLPEGMQGRRFLEDRHLGTEVDPDLEMGDA
ncbi:hypothetical protein VD0001_g2336 [Verticillium dahliae]|nr:hypothetical protein VD0001_g2336 [Verticillium dahliae]